LLKHYLVFAKHTKKTRRTTSQTEPVPTTWWKKGLAIVAFLLRNFPFHPATSLTSRMPTWNFTLNNMEAHAKQAKTEPETLRRNMNSAQNTNRNPALSPQKFFSALNVHPNFGAVLNS
jgi:hypothetical protein